MSDMTNAVAIETLRANYPDACYEQLREAVDAAISALKAQQAAGDTISRKQTVDAIADYALKMQEKFGHKLTINQCREAVYGVLDAIPPARPKLGKEKT